MSSSASPTPSLGKATDDLRYASTGKSSVAPTMKSIDALVTDQNPDSAASRRCEAWRDQLIETSPRIRTLLASLAASKCPLTPSRHITFVNCGPTLAGGFGPAVGIQLCANVLQSRQHLEDTLAHELVHAYDFCTRDVRLEDIRHHACTEIRAASLSGDCEWGREIKRGNLGFFGQFEKCVKRRAALAIAFNPSCKGPAHARAVVDEVFPSCIDDTAPFTKDNIVDM
ncbi:Mitochondrial inner membrane protease atp23 [Thoreauomyces humboldtii]|nr:Mitochondrial inner membrane protease atp23 [Thoreauomyces humboldtii]